MSVLAVVLGLAACRDQPGGAVPEVNARQQFATVCARCHGPEGGGGAPAGEGAPAPRDFRDAAFQKSRSDAEIARTITSGKPPGMPAFGGTLSPAAIEGLVQVVRSFDPGKKVSD